MVAWNEKGQGYFTFEEMENIIDTYIFMDEVFNSLKVQFTTELFKDMVLKFSVIQFKHFSVWESDERKEQHSFMNLDCVKWDRKEQCFKVFYKKTKHFEAEWYHYTLKGDWY